MILLCGPANYYRCLAQWSNSDTTLVCATILLGCLYSTEWNDGMEWNGMTTPTQRTLTTDTYCVCHLQPRSSSSIKENGLNQIQQPEGDLII